MSYLFDLSIWYYRIIKILRKVDFGLIVFWLGSANSAFFQLNSAKSASSAK